MTITFGWNVFQWRIWTFDVRIDVDQTAGGQQVVDRTVKGITRRWVRHMAS